VLQFSVLFLLQKKVASDAPAVVLPAVAAQSTEATTSHHRQQQTSKSYSQLVIASQ
jgi:hypothetical protein